MSFWGEHLSTFLHKKFVLSFLKSSQSSPPSGSTVPILERETFQKTPSGAWSTQCYEYQKSCDIDREWDSTKGGLCPRGHVGKSRSYPRSIIYWVEAKDACGHHPAMPRLTPHYKGLVFAQIKGPRPKKTLSKRMFLERACARMCIFIYWPMF